MLIHLCLPSKKGFVYLKYVKCQMDLHRNVQKFAKCNVCISALHVQSFSSYIGNIVDARFLKT